MQYKIRELRESKNMTQSELAERSGVARATIWKLETGVDAVTTTSTLTKIADALETTVDALFLPVQV